MNTQKIHDKLAGLKNLISQMSSNTIELIEASAELEIKLRKNGLSKNELTIINDELEGLIEKYSEKINQREK